MQKLNRFAVFAYATLAVTILVILWGTIVKATGSGDGCGASWPACNGEILPTFEGWATVIEFTHRLTSGLVLLMSIMLFFWARRKYSVGHAIRKAAGFTLFFMVVESLVGAVLVVFRLVGEDSSMARAIVAPIHLVNTLFLVTAIALTAYFASGGKPFPWRVVTRFSSLLLIGFVGLILVNVSGAVTSLGDAIFPVQTTSEAISRSLTPGEHILVRLRIWHPAIAIVVGLYLVLAAGFISRKAGATVKTAALSVFVIYLLQLAVGFINVATSAALLIQVLHLLLSNVLWLAWLYLTALSMRQSPVRLPYKQPQLVGGSD